MSTRLRDVLMGHLDELRHEPIDKRIRATLDGETIVDSTRALLVWEPKRIVPSYAVPLEDVAARPDDVTPAGHGEPAADALMLLGRPVLDPSVPFSVHTADGEALMLRARAGDRTAAAFRPADPALAEYLVLDFAGFDAWYEEDERNVGHPRDPFHRIDIVHSSRAVRVEVDGEVLAESDRPCALFEPPLPVRYYLPPEDVRTDLLRPSDTRSWCAYKGEASYWSFRGEDVAWHYPKPLREAAEITGRVAFFAERTEIVVDGEPVGRPITAWSPR